MAANFNESTNEWERKEGKEASSLGVWGRRALSKDSVGPGLSKKEERLAGCPTRPSDLNPGQTGTGRLHVGEARAAVLPHEKLAWLMGWGNSTSQQEIQLDAVWPLHSLMRTWFLDWVYQWVQKKVSLPWKISPCPSPPWAHSWPNRKQHRTPRRQQILLYSFSPTNSDFRHLTMALHVHSKGT